MVNDGSHQFQGNLLSMEDLRDLFTFHENVRSEIHEKMNCVRCQYDDDGPESIEKRDVTQLVNGSCPSNLDTSDIGGFADIAGCLSKLKSSERQVGAPLEEDIGNWGHHFFPTSVPDAILQASAGDEITFVFTNQVDGKLVPIESAIRPNVKQTEEIGNHPKLKQSQNQKTAFITHRRNPQESSLFKQDSIRISSCAKGKPFQRDGVSLSPLKGFLHGASKSKVSLGNQVPQKRSSPYSVEHDDDFQ